ncbi:MAG TPA: hypothetical protein VNP04_13600 [Alphaproteobacteria bacterium]|nr:hypothetical protein [Alphaproteobacteria bacterium]
MATQAIDLKGKIFADLSANSAILALLGSVTATNLRIYAGWPQQQPELSNVEPSEGWLTFHEVTAYKPFQLSLWKDHVIQFDIWSKLQTINDRVVDLLDAMYDRAPVDQDGLVITDDWFILSSHWISGQEIYEQEIKLYHKIATYQFRTLKRPYRLGA